MASTFLRKVSSNIGNVAATVGSYTVSSNTGAVVIGLTVANTSNVEISANVSLYNGITDYYLVKLAPIPAEGALVPVGGDQKIVLQANDSIRVSSSISNSIDVIMTLLETDSIGFTNDPITYSIISNRTSVDEGNTVGFTVSTSNVPDSTVLYWTTLGNVSSADFSDSVTSGNVTVSGGIATITRILTADTTTEGVEYFNLELRTGSTSGTIVATSGNVTVVDTSVPAALLLYTLNNPTAYSTSSSDNFGSYVSISDNYAIVSAPNEDDAGGSDSGKAYIYSTQSGALLYTLNNPNAFNTSAFDFFTRVAISGNLVIVGAPNEDGAGGSGSGKAYIYDISTFASNVISSATYTLNNPNAFGTSADDNFGSAVSISGNLAIVSAFIEDDAGGSDSGKAYIYDISTFASNVISSATYTLNNPNAFGTSANDYFGEVVAISGNLAIVGGSGEDATGNSSSGGAYIYDISTFASNVISSATYTLNNPNAFGTRAFDYFGSAVSISGNLAIVGAFSEDDAGGSDSGKAYIYDISTFASNVVSSATYTLNNPNAFGTSADDYFGRRVTISGDLAIVGAFSEDDAGGSDSGKAYVYKISTFASNVISSPTYTLNNPNAFGTSAGDLFGDAVAISGNLAIVGARAEDDAGGTSSGKAYIYTIS